jgi:hypothetical protein
MCEAMVGSPKWIQTGMGLVMLAIAIRGIYKSRSKSDIVATTIITMITIAILIVIEPN